MNGKKRAEKAFKYHLVRSSWGKDVSHQGKGWKVWTCLLLLLLLLLKNTITFFGVRHKLGMNFVSWKTCDDLLEDMQWMSKTIWGFFRLKLGGVSRCTVYLMLCGFYVLGELEEFLIISAIFCPYFCFKVFQSTVFFSVCILYPGTEEHEDQKIKLT